MAFTKKLQSIAKLFIYQPVEEVDEDEKLLRNECGIQQQRRHRVSDALPWMISTTAFAILALVLFFKEHSSNSLGTYENGFKTDFGKLASISTPKIINSHSMNEQSR